MCCYESLYKINSLSFRRSQERKSIWIPQLDPFLFAGETGLDKLFQPQLWWTSKYHSKCQPFSKCTRIWLKLPRDRLRCVCFNCSSPLQSCLQPNFIFIATLWGRLGWEWVTGPRPLSSWLSRDLQPSAPGLILTVSAAPHWGAFDRCATSS